MKQNIKLENKHLSTFFFGWFILFFGMCVKDMVVDRSIHTMTAIMVFMCLILSMSFKTWQLIREVEDKIDYVFINEMVKNGRS